MSGLFVLVAAAVNWLAYAITANRYVGIAAASWFLVGGMLAIAKGLRSCRRTVTGVPKTRP